ncbi:hypothetical protein [Prauserella muralis]|uniref:Uncharacterized protein n=1 Tax=Prauserella muralis TaxID=588067 RepID=A0A2V4B556_9PSEU|nr:hypothetical protein [Prauserella muralis]PXY28205.1 hypothetical protein BAY60_17925 [Prauserella muralis]TWE21978.1 hypothetical protein FHX69_3210 [Prauserella muralis]
MSGAGGRDAEPRARRAEFRAYVRAHHPDAGGDADAFVAGLARFAERGRRSSVADRADAPVVFVSRPGALTRLVRWWRRRRSPPRVR